MSQQTIDAFLTSQRARGLSSSTIRRREWSLAKFVDPAAVSIDELETVIADVGEPESRRAVVSDLRAYLRWCSKRDIAVSDATWKLEPIKVPKRLPTPLTRAELEAVVAIASGPTRWAVMLAAYAGLRVFEIAALDYADVRRDLGVIIVRQGKGARDESVAMAPALADALPIEGVGRVFPGANGDAISYRLRSVLRRAGVKRRPHDLRHTFGTEVARVAGGDGFVVQKLMRHQQISTSQRYVLVTASGGEVVSRLYGAA